MNLECKRERERVRRGRGRQAHAFLVGMSHHFQTTSSVYGSFYASGCASLPPRQHVSDKEAQLVLLQKLHQAQSTSQGDHLFAAKASRQARTRHGTCNHALSSQIVAPSSKDIREYLDVASAGTEADVGELTHIVRARLLPQPGDGSCLFHSLAQCFGTDAISIRREVADAIEINPELEVSGTALARWIEWDSGITPFQYANNLCGHSWGGVSAKHDEPSMVTSPSRVVRT